MISQQATKIWSGPEIERIYRRRARFYDWTIKLYYLTGFREWAYRRKTIECLDLRPGDTVVDIGCGTGLNFPLLERAVGPKGTIVGVDLTSAMLDQAAARIKRCGWSNVKLVHGDAADFAFPTKLDGVLSFCAITLMPEYDAIIRNGAAALKPGGRFAIFDLKEPSSAPDWLINLAEWIERPFAVQREMAARHPWESMQKHLKFSVVEPVFFGFGYVAFGVSKQTDEPSSPGS